MSNESCRLSVQFASVSASLCSLSELRRVVVVTRDMSFYVQPAKVTESEFKVVM